MVVTPGVASALAAVWLGLAGASSPPNADVPEPALSWSAPATCPDATWARASLASQLRGALPADTVVQIDIVPASPGFAATIAVRGNSTDTPFAPRRLVAGDCEALARAAVLVVAVAIDPIAVVGPSDPQDAADPPPSFDLPEPLPRTRPSPVGPSTPITGPLVDRTAPPSTPRSPARWHHALRITGGVGSTIIPALTGVVQLGYAAIRSGWRIETHGGWLVPVDRRYDDGAGARLQAITLSLRGCPSPTIGRVTLAVCLGLEGGSVVGRGTGVPRSTRAVSGWLAAELGVAAVVAVHPRLGVVLAADVTAAALRPAFHLGARADLFDAPIVGGRGLVGLEVRLR